MSSTNLGKAPVVEQDVVTEAQSHSLPPRRKRPRTAPDEAKRTGNDPLEKPALAPSESDADGSRVRNEAVLETNALELLEEQLAYAPLTAEESNSVLSALAGIERLARERPERLVTPKEGLMLIRAVWQGLMTRTSGTRDWRIRARAMRLLSAVLPVDDRSLVNLRGSYASGEGCWYWMKLDRQSMPGLCRRSSEMASVTLAETPERDARVQTTALTTVLQDAGGMEDSSFRRSGISQGSRPPARRQRSDEALDSIDSPLSSTFGALLRMLASNLQVETSEAVRLFSSFLSREEHEAQRNSTGSLSHARVRLWATNGQSLIERYLWTEACALGILDAALGTQLEADPLFHVLLLLRMWMYSLRFEGATWPELQRQIWNKLAAVLRPRTFFVLSHIRLDEEHRWMPWKRQGCPRFEKAPLAGHDHEMKHARGASASTVEPKVPSLPWLPHEADITEHLRAVKKAARPPDSPRVFNNEALFQSAAGSWFLCRYSRAFHLDWLLEATDQSEALDAVLRKRCREDPVTS
jgi:hypothetical protein